MLFTTLNQGSVFLVFVYWGLLVGVCAGVLKILLLKLCPKQSKQEIVLHPKKPKNTQNKTNKKQSFKTVVYHLIIGAQILAYTALFGVLLYFFNFGELRLFCVAGYVLGFFATMLTIQYFAKLMVLHKLKKSLKAPTKK